LIAPNLMVTILTILVNIFYKLGGGICQKESTMHCDFRPVVEGSVFELRADYSALSIVGDGVRNSREHPVIADLVEELCLARDRPWWSEPHLESWRRAYRAFGAKPQRTPCSAEVLLRRLEQEGCLPKVNALVDFYNALSVRFSLPIGGEDRAAYVGVPRLMVANGQERFDTKKNGAPCEEQVAEGEVIWRDSGGVTCRRWNWRQCVRTRIQETTSSIWFVFDRLEPMPMSALLEAGALLCETLRQLNPDAILSSLLIDRANPEGRAA
jgi:DNA/RNA-binding domain of Phe-tRNA-synthetase-like protein